MIFQIHLILTDTKNHDASLYIRMIRIDTLIRVHVVYELMRRGVRGAFFYPLTNEPTNVTWSR